MEQNTQQGHPKGLYLLFMTEMWERFSYYGMRALLALYMVNALLFTKEEASNLYGNYTSLVYLTPLLGGYIADRFWGNRRSIFVGGILMAIGQFLLFGSGLYLDNHSMAYTLFLSGLGFLILGNGFFKPNISTMVGQLYPAHDTRKDAAFTIFYMGINLGAFFAPLVCGYFGEVYDENHNPVAAAFKWGFFAAGVGMVISIITFELLKGKYIITPEGQPIGMPPAFYKNQQDQVREEQEAQSAGPLTGIEIQRIAVIFILAFFVIFFWAAFEQAGASLTFFAEEQTNRHFDALDWTMPASWFQSFNPVFIIVFAPVFAALWTFLGKRNLEPPSPLKMAIGLFLLSVGYLVIAFGVKGLDPKTKVSMIWLTSMYLLHTFGELSLSPIGLSMVNKLSPIRFASLLMGVWFLANSAANKFAGVLSALYPEEGKAHPHFLGFEIDGLYTFFMVFVVLSGVAAIVLFALYSLLVKMMHGVK